MSLRILFKIVLVFMVMIGPACSQSPAISAKKDVAMLLNLVKISLKQQYFDQVMASKLTDQLTAMENQKKFEHVSAEKAAQMITDFLRSETHDKHFNISAYTSESITQAVSKSPQLSAAGISDYHIEKNNIGYIKWNSCIAGEAAFQEFRKVLDKLAGCSSLIFDLSENAGGDGASSAFVNQFLYRDKSYQTLLRKRCKGEKDWHQSEVIFNYTEGPTFFDKPIYIIASKQTFSAAEYFILTAKEMKRATILGDTTAGAGNPGNSQGIRSPDTDTIFWLFIPNCEIITRNGHSIEGSGVKPDVVLRGKNWLKQTLDYVAKVAR